MRKAFAWGIGLLITSALCTLVTFFGAGEQGNATQGAYCLIFFIVLAALGFFLAGMVQKAKENQELAAVARIRQQPQAAPPQEEPPQQPRQWRRSELLDEDEDKPKEDPYTVHCNRCGMEYPFGQRICLRCGMTVFH